MTGACKIMTDECAKEFGDAADERRDMTKAINKLSDRLFKTNGERAIVETIRDNAKALERHEQAHEDIHDILGVMSVPDPKPDPVPTLSADPNATKFEYGKFKVTTNSAELIAAVTRFVYLAVVISSVLYGVKFLTDMKTELHAKITQVEKAVIED